MAENEAPLECSNRFRYVIFSISLLELTIFQEDPGL